MNYPAIPREFFNGDCFDAYRILGAHQRQVMHQHHILLVALQAVGGRLANGLAAAIADQLVGVCQRQVVAGAFIEHLEGSYSGVMGLPLHETALLLREFGL